MLDNYKIIFIKLSFTFLLLFLCTNYSLAKEENQTLLKGSVNTDVVEQYPASGVGVVGLRYIHKTGFPTFVEEVYENSPASIAGIKKHDLIYTVDGIRTDKLSSDIVFGLLSGKPNTKVNVLIVRGRTKLELELTREDITQFPENIQARYLAGPIQVPFDGSDFGDYFY